MIDEPRPADRETVTWKERLPRLTKTWLAAEAVGLVVMICFGVIIVLIGSC